MRVGYYGNAKLTDTAGLYKLLTVTVIGGSVAVILLLSSGFMGTWDSAEQGLDGTPIERLFIADGTRVELESVVSYAEETFGTTDMGGPEHVVLSDGANGRALLLLKGTPEQVDDIALYAEEVLSDGSQDDNDDGSGDGSGGGYGSGSY